MLFFVMLVQVVGLIISLTIEDFSHSFLPYPHYTVPIVNCIGSCIAVFIFLFPRFKLLQSVSFFLFGILMTLNDLLFLGVLLYSQGFVLLFCNKYLEKNNRRKICIILAVWLCALLLIISQSIYKFCMAVSYSLFLGFFYAYVYFAIRQSLLSLFPITAQSLSSKELPELGTTLFLNQFEFTERQEKIVLEFSKNYASYKELADSIGTSESTIKREMTEIFEKFGVRNATELRVLLSQYKIMSA